MNKKRKVSTMTKNVGSIDRVLRLISGLVLLGLYFFGPQTTWGLLGVVPIFTALISWCPVYVPFKISTLKKNNIKGK